ncbi:MAG: ATP-binding protein [Victivallaceae bacterium]
MLIRFSVENFLSYKERQTLDLRTVKTCKEHAEDNTFVFGDIGLLKSAVIYGANASGKSNLFTAITKMKQIVMNSAKESQSVAPVDVTPFAFCSENYSEQTTFEIEFICQNVQYRYGFSATQKEITAEWFLQKNSDGVETPFFYRINENGEDKIQVFESMGKINDSDARTRTNSLFLSECDSGNVEIAKRIMKWFNELYITSGLNDEKNRNFTIEKFKSESLNGKISQFICDADLNIVDLQASYIVDLRASYIDGVTNSTASRYIKNININQSIDNSLANINKTVDNLLANINKTIEKLGSSYGADLTIPEIKSTHNIYDSQNNVIGKKEFNFDEIESAGTKKAFALAGPIINALQNGYILFVDELEARLHPIFTRKIVQMFNSREQNPNNAQLIFATHDSNLLNKDMLRRDQIWFAEKNHGEATELYSLIDYILDDKNKVRNDASYGKDYLNGRYGAIPFLSDLKVFGDANE